LAKSPRFIIFILGHKAKKEQNMTNLNQTIQNELSCIISDYRENALGFDQEEQFNAFLHTDSENESVDQLYDDLQTAMQENHSIEIEYDFYHIQQIRIALQKARREY
jgi:hypothetical protein